MAYLFRVALRGTGTRDVEAFSSYIHRLANMHCVSAGTLLRYVISRHKTEHPEQGYCLSGVKAIHDLCVLVRPNETTQQLIEIFAHAAGEENLRCGTFLAMTEALQRPMDTFVTYTRWCPACIRDFHDARDTGYFKLLWQLKAISFCPTHRIALRDCCSKCRANQGGVGVRSNRLTCWRCHYPLSVGDYSTGLPTWINDETDLIELVESIASDPNLLFPAGGVRDVVAAILRSVTVDRTLREEIFRADCIKIATGDAPITLNRARQLAYLLSIHLPDLLAGVVTPQSSWIDWAWTAELPQSMRRQRQREDRDKAAVLRCLNNLLAIEKYRAQPPALKVVAGQLGLSVGYLQYHFPKLAMEIVKQHRDFCQTENRRKRLEARAAALAFLIDNKYAAEPKSRKRALRVLREETGLPKNVLREEIGVVFQEKLTTQKQSMTYSRESLSLHTR